MPAPPGLPVSPEPMTADGLRLHLQRWTAAGTSRGTVLIVHGLGEHSGRYAAVAAELNAVGWDVAAYDHRGHGRSDGARGAIADPASLLADLAVVIDRIDRSRPLVLLGHSLGGLVAARFVAQALMGDTMGDPMADAARWSRDVDGLVLSSPAFGAGLSLPQRLLLAVAQRVAPGLQLSNGLKPAWLSHDRAVVGAYAADPLVHDRVTPGLVRFIVDAGATVRGCAARWRVPTLLMWAGADRCVDPAATAAFAAAAPPDAVRSREFAALYHEIFNEPERREVLDTLTRWLAFVEAAVPHHEELAP